MVAHPSKRRCERHLDVSPASVCPGVGPGTPDFRVGAPCSEGLAGRVQGNGNGFTGCQIAGHSRPQLHSVREMYFDSDLAQRNAGRVLHGAYEGLGSSVIPQNEAGTGTHHVVGLARPVLGSGFLPHRPLRIPRRCHARPSLRLHQHVHPGPSLPLPSEPVSPVLEQPARLRASRAAATGITIRCSKQNPSCLSMNLLIHESPLTDALFLLVSKSDEVTTT